MKSFKKQIISSLMLGSTALSFATPIVAIAQDGQPQDDTVTIYKTAFTGDIAPTIDNKGKPLAQLPTSVSFWNRQEHGEVGFLVKTITAQDIEAIPALAQQVGEIKKNPLSNHYSLTNEQATKVKEYMKAHPYETDRENSIFKTSETTDLKFINDSGSVTVPVDVDASDSADIIAIIIEEGQSPSGFTKVKAEPIVLPVPVTNDEGTGYNKNYTFYPKNQLQTLSFELKKYGDNLAGTDGKRFGSLGGAKFQLYKGEPGQGTAIGQPVETNANGIITVDNLTKGKYYFVELPSTKVGEDAETETKEYLLGFSARNNARNQLVFTVDDNTKPDTLNADFLNYTPPTVKKEMFSQEVRIQASDVIGYVGKVKIPQNIKGAVTTVGGKTTTVHPYTKLNYVDTANKALTYDENSFSVLIDGVSETTQEKKVVTFEPGVDFTLSIDKDNNQARVELTEKGIQKTYDFPGQDLQITYRMKLTKDVTPNVAYENKYFIEYSNDPDGNVTRVTDEEEISFKTYGVKFKKTDDGLFGTGIGDNGLKGAKFLLRTPFVPNGQPPVYYVGIDEFGNHIYATTGPEPTPVIPPEDNPDISEGIDYFPPGTPATVDGNYEIEKGDSYNQPKVLYNQTFDKIKSIAEQNGWVFESSETGEFEIKGIAQGTYELEEIVAPEGYQILDNPYSFTVTSTSWTEAIKEIENTRKPNMPLTGSEKIVVFAGAGLTVLGAYAIMSKKKKKTE